jgi:2-methylisocitrate lyase-like PEP mutase family enzyme
MNEAAQLERAQRFRALHSSGTFVIANCWDGGSARILTSLGFPALATSSGASAGTLGRLDGNVSIEESMAQSKIICGATTLPVSADLEKGFGDAPDATAKAIKLAASVGLVGGSIEDARTRPSSTLASPPNALPPRPKRLARCPSRSR